MAETSTRPLGPIPLPHRPLILSRRMCGGPRRAELSPYTFAGVFISRLQGHALLV